MADTDRIKLITDNLESTYQNLLRAYASISGLLAVGRATCDEVRAYNLWALATYNAQRGMLATLRAEGEQNIPDLPPNPSLFAWNGVDGNDAINIDCTGQASSLSGALSAALQPTGPQTQYLGLDKIRIVTTDQHAFDPEKSPSFANLLAVQDARATQQQGLGNPIVLLIVIAAIVVGVSVAISALMKYLDDSKLQEETTARTKLQSDAFQAYAAARLQCYQGCIAGGKTPDDCVATCQNLVDKPNIDISCVGPTCPSPSWGALQWIGFTVVLGVVSVVGYKIWERRRRGQPLFELPDLPDLHPI